MTMQLPKQDHYEVARDAALARLTADLDPARLEALGCRSGSRCRSPGRSLR